jgi:hypothetical protein
MVTKSKTLKKRINGGGSAGEDYIYKLINGLDDTRHIHQMALLKKKERMQTGGFEIKNPHTALSGERKKTPNPIYRDNNYSGVSNGETDKTNSGDSNDETSNTNSGVSNGETGLSFDPNAVVLNNDTLLKQGPTQEKKNIEEKQEKSNGVYIEMPETERYSKLDIKRLSIHKHKNENGVFDRLIRNNKTNNNTNYTNNIGERIQAVSVLSEKELKKITNYYSNLIDIYKKHIKKSQQLKKTKKKRRHRNNIN